MGIDHFTPPEALQESVHTQLESEPATNMEQLTQEQIGKFQHLELSAYKNGDGSHLTKKGRILRSF